MSSKTLREVITSFAYDATEKIAAETEIHGDETMYGGYPAYKDDSKMAKGALINSVVHLAVSRYKNGDGRYKHDLERINLFAKMFLGDTVSTWGKRLLLSGLCVLYDAGLYGELSQETTEIFENVSDYSDFLDKETVTIKPPLPTNYYHVALACALYREKLGMENDGMSEKLLSKLLSIMENCSSEGWADEAPGFGRFDSYSVESVGETIAPLRETGKEIPDVLVNSMKKSVRLCLALANGKGHGFMYGRSLAYHGDAAPLHVLCDGLEMGLVPEKDIPTAVGYIINTVKKVTEFWYDERVGAINLWLFGRATNGYRNITRFFEVNNCANETLMRALAVAEKMGFADYPVEYTEVGYTDKWEYTETVFDKSENYIRSLFILKRQGRVFGLPFICMGSARKSASYNTFPASASFIETPPEVELDFLTPRYELCDGRILVPTNFWEETKVEASDDCVRILAKGSMTDMSAPGGLPVKSDKRFTVNFEFCGDKIRVLYNAENCDVKSVYMMYCGKAKVHGIGFECENSFDATDKKYDMWHGNAGKGIEFYGKDSGAGYEINLL